MKRNHKLLPKCLLPKCLLLLVSCTAAAMAQAPSGNPASDLELWKRFQQQEVALLKTAPKEAVSDHLDFLRAGANTSPALSVTVAIDAWQSTIELAERTLKDPLMALALCDEALGLYGTAPRATVLLATKARILNYEGRYQETQAFVEANWAQVVKGPVSQARRIVWYECVALQSQEKGAEVPAILKRILLQNALLLDEEYQATNGWMYRYLVKGLLAQGKTEEALSWAKLRWMECAFDDDHVQGAASSLAQVWQADADKNGPQALQGFITTQQSDLPAVTEDKATPTANPLQAVPLPSLDNQELQAQLVRLASSAGDVLHEQNTHGRINLLILSGDWGGAMTQAYKLWQDPTTSARGVKEIARIYKARDLNLARANAFLDWLATNQGPNPLEKFFAENPLRDTPPRPGDAA
jgi:hypothetical protein